MVFITMKLKSRRGGIICGVLGFCVLFIIVYKYISNNDNITADQDYVDILLDMSKSMIKLEMWDYDYSKSNVQKLEDLTMESGGNPIRSVIVSTWRSGSNFFGDFLNSVPATFYSHEPLAVLNIDHTFRNSSLITIANQLIKHLLQCTPKSDVIEYYKFAQNALSHKPHLKSLLRNRRFYDKCKLKPQICEDANFGMKLCRISPFHVIKLDRMILPGLKILLENKELNDVKLVFLVRDPRGVLHSRLYTGINICYKDHVVDNKNIMVPDCADPAIVCDDMITNYKTTAEFTRIYPGRLMVVRYEDMVLNHDVIAPKVLNFLNIDFTQSVSDFLRAHTNASSDDLFSTFRISRNVPFKWKYTMKFKDVQNIQSKCAYAMSLWGYKLAQNESQMTSDDFYPLSSFTVN